MLKKEKKKKKKNFKTRDWKNIKIKHLKCNQAKCFKSSTKYLRIVLLQIIAYVFALFEFKFFFEIAKVFLLWNSKFLVSIFFSLVSNCKSLFGSCFSLWSQSSRCFEVLLRSWEGLVSERPPLQGCHVY